MSGAGSEFAQACDDNLDPSTCPTSGQPDHSSLHQDNITQHSIPTQISTEACSEKHHNSVPTDQSICQGSFSYDLWGLGQTTFAAPCTSHALAGSSINSSEPYLPPSSQSDLFGADGNTTQGNLASLSYESFTTPSSLPNTSWESDSYRDAVNPPKIGRRFSRESSKLLTQWFSNHYSHPYPSKEEIESLQYQTGLSKTQINNWLANTRRRDKMRQSVQSSQNAMATIDSNTVSINIPRRPDTPTVQTRLIHRTMGPLERWVDSPPESEPATVSAIANAVHCAESSRTWPLSKPIDDGSGQSINESSDNSLRTSSGSSLASIYSYGSSDSVTGGPALVRSTSRRRRRRLFARPKRSLVGNKQHPFPCTFCAETFKTKYDWQRHEKTLHIPLERWLCSPDGPRAINPETGQPNCAFCGESEPTDSHIDSHNPYSCQERVFHRKDHLKQHLYLVHKSKLVDAVTKGWKTSTPIIRSRCGFCGTNLDSWNDRVEHLADHFKMGKTMANWTGDWGFEDAIADTLENAIPPYLLGEERNSPFPFEASDASPESPRTAYELLFVELSCFVETHQYKTGQFPDFDAMQIEACRIIFASEVLSLEEDTDPSWLRDLVFSNEILATQAQFLPIRTPSEGRLRTLEIRGKKTLFQECPLEAQLNNFVLTETLINQTIISNETLQVEACKILTQMQQSSKLSLSDFVFTWFMTLLQSSSTNWLSHFRRRANLPVAQSGSTPTSPIFTASSTILGYPYTNANDLDDLGIPSEEARRKAFPLKQMDEDSRQQLDGLQIGAYMLHDPNFFKWLGRELGRWVSSIMSPKNPNCHIPSDEEIQHHARYLVYNDDDPWNQTVADNAEWLHRFKVGVGIIPE